MKKTILPLFIIISISGYSQKNLKTYQKANKFQKETYTYYVNPNTVALNIKHGAYSFSENYPNSKTILKGKFKNDVKDGRWTYESSSAIQDSYNNQKYTKNYNQYYIDYTDGGAINGEYYNLNQTEEYNGITRTSQITNNLSIKYIKNTLKSVDISEIKNGIKQNFFYDFDNQGFLKNGTYCFDKMDNPILCDGKNSEERKLSINEFGIATIIPKKNYNYGYEFDDDIDDVSIEYAKKYKEGSISFDELERNNIEVVYLNFYKIYNLIKLSELEINLLKNLNGGIIYGKYKNNRNKLLFDELFGSWKLVEVISDNKSNYLGNQSEAKFNFQDSNLLSIHQNNNDRVGERLNIRIDGKNRQILFKENNDYTPIFTILSVDKDNLVLERKTTDNIKQILKFTINYR